MTAEASLATQRQLHTQLARGLDYWSYSRGTDEARLVRKVLELVQDEIRFPDRANQAAGE